MTVWLERHQAWVYLASVVLGLGAAVVVLPFAIALPAGFEIAVVAVVFQSLVELFGMIVYLRVVPRLVPQP